MDRVLMPNPPDMASMVVPFNRGIDTKTDPKMVQPPFLLMCRDGNFQTASCISKRFGFTVLGKQTSTGAVISAAYGCASFNNELLCFDNTQLYSWGPESAAWYPRGAATSAVTTSETVIRNAFQQSAADWDINDNVAMFAWLDSRGGVRMSVVDQTTGAYYQTDVSLKTTGTVPRVIALGMYLFCLYGDGTGNLWIAGVNLGAPQVLAFNRIFASDMAATSATYFGDIDVGTFPAVSLGNNQSGPAFVSGAVVYTNSSNTATCAIIALDGNVGSAANGWTAPVRNSTASGCTIHSVTSVPTGQANPLFVTSYNPTNNTLYSYAMYIGPGNLQVSNTGTVTTTGTVPSLTSAWTQITEIFGGTPYIKNASFCLYESISAGVHTINVAVTDGNTVNSTVFAKGLGLGAEPFLMNGTLYYILTYGSPTTQNCYFIVSQSGQIISRHLYGEAAGFLPGPTLPKVHQTAPGTFAWPAIKQGQLTSQNGTVFTLTGVQLESVDFSEPQFNTAQLENALFVPGGFLQSYDGSALVEHGFLLSPEPLSVSGTATTGGSMSNGTYLYTHIFEWTDNDGNVHRSAGSNPISVTLSGGGSTQSVTLAVPPLPITLKSNVILSVFRTTNNGNVFFKVTSPTAPLVSVPGPAQAFTDTRADTAILSNEILYTVGGEIDNDPPPPASIVVAGKRRIFLAGTEDPNTIYYSKQEIVGEGLGFSLAFSLTVDPIGGDVTAMGIMDDKVVLFKANTILFFNGDGPDATGANNSFTTPVIVASDVGCPNQASVVQTSDGLYFQSQKGIYLLNRALQVSYEGAPVEAYNGQTISSAILHPTLNQVRFGCYQGDALIYNYFSEEPYADDQQIAQWSTYTNYAQTDACVWQSQYVFAMANGNICVENTGYVDGTTPISMHLILAWINAETLGFMRVFEVGLLGTFYSPHTLITNIRYDYKSYLAAQLQFNTTVGMPSETWGQDPTWGNDATWGGFGDDAYMIRSRIPLQQCSAAQLEIYDLPIGNPGQGYSLNAINLQVGKIQGLNRGLGPAKTV